MKPDAIRGERSAGVVCLVGSSADEYGADRMLMASVAALETETVLVILPEDGPLVAVLQGMGAQVDVLPDFAIRRGYLHGLGLIGVAKRNLGAVNHLRRRNAEQAIDVVVSNTMTVLCGALFSLLARRRHVWHVHEILGSRGLVAVCVVAMIDRLSCAVITCSRSVRDFLVAVRPSIAKRVVVVMNGIELPSDPVPGRVGAPVRVGCVGRINRWKGQRVLLDAFAEVVRSLPLGTPTPELHYFGSAYRGNEHLERDLLDRSRTLGLGGCVYLHGHVSDRDAIYSELDVVVAPSIEPEPFSLVCAEAQAYGLPVIGPDVGGPTEIVVNGETGLLVSMADLDALVEAIRVLVVDSELRMRFGKQARARASHLFGIERYRSEWSSVVGAQLSRGAPARRDRRRCRVAGSGGEEA